MMNIHPVVRILKREIRRWKIPVLGVVADETRDPFQVLVSCLLSLRTRDAVTAAATERLAALGRSSSELARVPTLRIQKAIYPVCFYRVKARTIKSLCRTLLDQHLGKVPATLEGLLALKGVGRKTANLVLTLGFRKPGICVDTHVHRIMNRLGYVRTKTPDETELALRAKLPGPYWMIINDLLVTYGQNLCGPTSPWCSRCKIIKYCARRGVKFSR